MGALDHHLVRHGGAALGDFDTEGAQSVLDRDGSSGFYVVRFAHAFIIVAEHHMSSGSRVGSRELSFHRGVCGANWHRAPRHDVA